MSKICISYRRSDSAAMAGRIFDHLVARYGTDEVFRDLEAIPPGADFRNFIESALERSEVLIVVIGRRWLARSRRDSAPRIMALDDPVRTEIEIALQRKVAIVPVLVERTKMPKPAEVPPQISGLAYLNAVRIDTGADFDVHMSRLIKTVDAVLHVDSTPVAPPSGTVTFLCTAIVDGAGLWERFPSAMPEALADHERTLREVFKRHRAYIFQAGAGEFSAAFNRASDAVEAAYDLERSLQRNDFSNVGGLQLRVAIHAGEDIEFSGNYFGRTAKQAGRLLPIAQGGQILISQVAADLLTGPMPDALGLLELGRYRLPDFDAPETLYQLTGPGLRLEFPATEVREPNPNNLPEQTTPLIGRSEVDAEVEAAVRENRLVTLFGAGGIGKTRVALEVARSVLQRFRDGVWLVELAPISDPSLIEISILSVLKTQEKPTGSPIDAIVAYFHERTSLLLLDNCEHLISAVANAAATLLSRCPGLQILATSREPLSIAGEKVYHVPPLSVPPKDSIQTQAELAAFGATALFVERAKAADSNFNVSESDVSTLVELCRRLDGIALAIELAAARTRVLTLQEIAERIDERLNLLTGGRRDVLPRQQTMRSLIDWSYDLLARDEKKVFRLLSVFADGATAEAAEFVCRGQVPSPALDLLTALVDKSLLVPERGQGDTRYKLLELTRAYAKEKLQEADELDAASGMYCEWTATFSERAANTRGTVSPSVWLSTLTPEIENIREALRFSLTEPTRYILSGCRVAAALASFWYMASAQEGRRWLELALRHLGGEEETALYGRLLLALAYVSNARDGANAAQRAIAILERFNPSADLARAYGNLAWNQLRQGDFSQALAAGVRALELWKLLGKERSFDYASDLDTYATIQAFAGAKDEARENFKKVLALYDAMGDDEGTADAQINLAELEASTGDAQAALALVTTASDVLHRLQIHGREALTRVNAAGYMLALGDANGAKTNARTALIEARRLQTDTVQFAIEHLATVAAVYGDATRAARLAGYIEAWYQSAGYVPGPTELRSREILQEALTPKLAAAEIQHERAVGATWSEEKAVAEALEI